MRKKITKKKNKSGKAPCDICKEPNFLDVHHIEGRDIPNANHKSNLTNVCPNCHRKIHMGTITIEKWVQSSDGPELLFYSKGEKSFSGFKTSPHLFI